MKSNKERNQKIYNRYTESGLSFNKLSKEFNLTPQRIQKIVSDYKTNEIAKTLSPTAKQDIREKYKNLSIEVRENGNLELSLKMFEQIIIWDNKNKNYRGLSDVYGHINIIYNKLAEKSIDKKVEYFEKATEYLQKAVDLINKGLAPAGSEAIIKVRIAATKNKRAVLLTGVEKNKELNSALKIIEEAIKPLPGSKAHKAWALKIKAQILAHLEEFDKAIDTLAIAEKHLYLGYDEELKTKAVNGRQIIGNDQAVMKIKIWLVGIQLTYAEIFEKSGKDLLAIYYANAVINTKDTEGILEESKKQAKEILNRLS